MSLSSVRIALFQVNVCVHFHMLCQSHLVTNVFLQMLHSKVSCSSWSLFISLSELDTSLNLVVLKLNLTRYWLLLTWIYLDLLSSFLYPKLVKLSVVGWSVSATYFCFQFFLLTNSTLNFLPFVLLGNHRFLKFSNQHFDFKIWLAFSVFKLTYFHVQKTCLANVLLCPLIFLSQHSYVSLLFSIWFWRAQLFITSWPCEWRTDTDQWC